MTEDCASRPTVLIGIGTAAALLGVCTRTLRRWDTDGRLKPFARTLGRHRRYDRREILALYDRIAEERGGPPAAGTARPGPVRAAVYARVSSVRQKSAGDLDRQRENVRTYCEERGYRVSGEYSDVGSGLNDGRRGMLKLLADISRGRHDVVVVNYADRLSRFGMNVFRQCLAGWGVRLELIHPTVIRNDPHAELVTDLTAILYSFMGRLYRARRGRAGTAG
jgi:putative resolvase